MSLAGAPSRNPESRVEEAADWFLRLREDDISDESLAEWCAWCADPENLREFQAIASVWSGAGQLSELPTQASGLRSSRIRRIHALFAGGTASTLARSVVRPRWVWAVAGVLLAIAVIYEMPFKFLGASGGRYAAEASVRSDQLVDGSTLILAPHTVVATEFEGASRHLRMSSGEAFFKVHHDPAKPFTVTTGELNVTAVGTAFDIKTDEAKVVVTVQEGVVSVAKTLAPESATWRVGRGDQIIYDRASGESSMAAVRVERFVSWQAGRLEYVGEPLGQVVADVSRYSSRPIEIGDPRLSRLTFTGTVLTGAINDWLEGVQTTFPIRVIVAQDGHYVLLNRSSQPTN